MKKRSLLFLLGVVLVAGLVGTLMARDPGYVLISFQGHSLQTGLWVFIALLVLLGWLGWWSIKLWNGFFDTTARLKRWRQDRSLSKSLEHTSRGLLYLHEGNSARAEKFLNSGIKHQPQPAINYLNLARAASFQGNAEQREQYLRQALEADAGAAAAVAMVRAELAFTSGDYQGCIHALDDAPVNERSQLLRKSVLVAQGDWSGVALLLPRLKKLLPETELLQLEAQTVKAVISAPDSTTEQRLGAYRQASEAVRQDPTVLLAVCGSVDAEKELEGMLRKAIKQNWQPDLVEAYARLGEVTAQKRLKTALGWQKQHPVDAPLQYCLGFLYELLGQKEEAQAAYLKAVEQGGHALASEQLAGLYASAGDMAKSNEYLNLAYRGA